MERSLLRQFVSHALKEPPFCAADRLIPRPPQHARACHAQEEVLSSVFNLLRFVVPFLSVNL